MTKFIIFIKDLTLSCFIGILDHEKESPQPIRIHLKCHVESPLPHMLHDPYLCYDQILRRIEEIAKEKHHLFLESFADEIIRFCFEFPIVKRAEISVEKISLYSHVSGVGIFLDVENKVSP